MPRAGRRGARDGDGVSRAADARLGAVTDPPACTMNTPIKREFTFRGAPLGALITLAFTAANVVIWARRSGRPLPRRSPAACDLHGAALRLKDSNILENNLVQTQASAAGTLSSVIFVLPALLMLGLWTGFPFWQTALICAAGGTLGVLYTVPLRRVLVAQSELPYPEGVAAARCCA